MKVRITTKFIEGDRLFGPGDWDVSDVIGQHLISVGRAKSLEGVKPNEDEKETTDEKGEQGDTSSSEGGEADIVTQESSPTADVQKEESGQKQEVVAPPKTPLQALAESDIPLGFPEREKLVAGGITSTSQLKEENIKERLEQIPGFGPATVTKIGLAITEL